MRMEEGEWRGEEQEGGGGEGGGKGGGKGGGVCVGNCGGVAIYGVGGGDSAIAGI